MPEAAPISGAQKLYWGPDSRHMAVVDGQRSIVIWDTTTGERVPIVTARPTASLVWSPDRSRVAATDVERVVTVYDTHTGARLSQFGAESGLESSRVLDVPVHRIRELIGPKGVVVRSIETRTHSRIDIEDDGTVTVTAESDADLLTAIELIDQILDPPAVAPGDVFRGTVATLTDYGAFVNILPGRDGLLHVNKLKRADWVVDVASVFAVGDEIEVVVENVLENGKIGLDLVAPLQRPAR